MGDLTCFLMYPTWVVFSCTRAFHGSRRGADIIPSPTVLKGVVATTTMVVVAASVVGGRGYGSTSVFGPVVEEE